MLPFLNPQIPAELGPVSLFVAMIIGLFVCSYSREPRPPSSPTSASIRLASVGVGVMVLGCIGMILISSRTISIDPNWESLGVRFAYFCFVVGAGAPLGWITARAF